MKFSDILTKINECALDDTFSELYGEDTDILKKQKERYIHALEMFSSTFPEDPDRDISIFSAPGRTEICGNHTDHQKGCVLAASVDLDTVAVVSSGEKHLIRIQSEGYPMVTIDTDDLLPREEEKNTTAALVRGVVAQFGAHGVKVSGFDAYITSNVLSGSGLSSSAAFEVLLGKIIDTRDNEGETGAIEIAKIGRFAENWYFGKACGLMDQTASSVGGLVEIDFGYSKNPKIDAHQFDFDKAGYALIITDTGGSHADLSEEYSAIPREMRSVARFFGKDRLAEVDEREFYARISKLRKDPEICERAILRSAHFFSDNARVRKEAQALDAGDVPAFLALVNESGESSAGFLQNLYCNNTPQSQAIPLALMMSRRILGNKGACRVHGGGFAGTIQAFVPKEKVIEYTTSLEGLFGTGACHILRIRPKGAVQII